MKSYIINVILFIAILASLLLYDIYFKDDKVVIEPLPLNIKTYNPEPKPEIATTLVSIKGHETYSLIIDFKIANNLKVKVDNGKIVVNDTTVKVSDNPIRIYHHKVYQYDKFLRLFLDIEETKN